MAAALARGWNINRSILQYGDSAIAVRADEKRLPSLSLGATLGAGCSYQRNFTLLFRRVDGQNRFPLALPCHLPAASSSLQKSIKTDRFRAAIVQQEATRSRSIDIRGQVGG